MKKFLLYTNPNNVTNRAYTAVGAQEVNDVLRSSRNYPDSYRILFQGKGNDETIKKSQQMFTYYQF
jgi:hypothetical protein